MISTGTGEEIHAIIGFVEKAETALSEVEAAGRRIEVTGTPETLVLQGDLFKTATQNLRALVETVTTKVEILVTRASGTGEYSDPEFQAKISQIAERLTPIRSSLLSFY
ncbi:MAG: hypothetical protein M1150_04110 [Patescibacteria group bacterium]|nr:hypothetical protein [Patescibacteria group bacterium]